MIVVVKCAKCGQKYALPAEAAGTTRQCRKCKGTIRVAPEPFKIRLQKCVAHHRVRQACHRLGWSLAVIAAIAAVVHWQRGPTAGEVRGRVHHALFGDITTRPGVKLWREMDNGDQWHIALDGQGRFRSGYEYKNLGLSQAAGFDGDVVWSKSIGGATRPLGLGYRDRALFYRWIRYGYWTCPNAPFNLKVNRKQSTRSTIALDVELQHSLLTGTMQINKRTWKPQSFVSQDLGQKKVDQYQRYVKTESGFFVDEYTMTQDGEEFGYVTEDGNAIIAGDLRHTFARRYIR